MATSEEDSECKLELSSKLYKFRKHNVVLKMKRSWRIAHHLSEPDVFSALLNARCYLLGSVTEAACSRCKCSPVIVLSATAQHPKYDASTDIESFECAVQSRCTSSRDHLKSSLVLAVDRLPIPSGVTSMPFVLYAREKNKPGSKKEAAKEVPPNPQQQQPLTLFKRGRNDGEKDSSLDQSSTTDPFTETPPVKTESPTNIPDCTNMLPEAFVSSFLLEKRNKRAQAEEANSQPPEQRPRHMNDPREAEIGRAHV